MPFLYLCGSSMAIRHYVLQIYEIKKMHVATLYQNSHCSHTCINLFVSVFTKQSPSGVARAACFEQLAGHCQLRCPALCKDLSQSEDNEVYRTNWRF